MSGRLKALKAFGPGILFAGAAIGVSHLVQSTRAGALFGLGLVPVILIALAIKYPAFQFGPRYAAATGTSLLEGYRRRGKPALILYAALTLGTLFTVQAAVTLVTAGLLLSLIGPVMSATSMSAVLLAVCGAATLVGGFRLLDGLVKIAVLFLTVATFIATALVLPQVDWGSFFSVFGGTNIDWAPTLPFIVALAGWMPTAVDISVWHSLWTLARGRDTGHAPSLRESVVDFNIGYWGTGVLSICFVFLGAALMFGAGKEIPNQATAFAAFVVGLYTDVLGDWSRVLIGGASFLVMFSTTITVLDGFPRAISCLIRRFRKPEPNGGDETPSLDRLYLAALVILAVGSVLVIGVFRGQLRQLVDLATRISFLTAPMLALLNHKAMTGAEVPLECQPNAPLRMFSLFCIVLLFAFAALDIWVQFF